MVQEATGKGAKLVMGGGADPVGKLFYKPTIITDLTSDMECFKDEIFGPVISIMRFKDEEVSLRGKILANSNSQTTSCVFLLSAGSHQHRQRKQGRPGRVLLLQRHQVNNMQHPASPGEERNGIIIK